MNFDLSDEQRLLQDTIRGFLARECPPAHLRAVFEGEGHDPTLWKGMVELGLGGLHLPDAWGGAGLELLDLALAAEVLGNAGAPGPFLGHALAGLAISSAPRRLAPLGAIRRRCPRPRRGSPPAPATPAAAASR